jgi:RNA polymerase sigma-70 factor (ECF subfamily)
MKIVAINYDLNRLIQLAQNKDRQAQSAIYKKFSPRMFSVCRQYLKDEQKAEDLLVTAFMKVFTHIDKFENKGSFEGWIRRIMVNECISYLRVNKKIYYTEEESFKEESANDLEIQSSVEEIQYMIDSLPVGCKMVFNLYAIDGYKHKEIAEMLDIEEGTSKSQLAYARKMLQAMITDSNKLKNGTQNR